jgi:hypothetical protein
LFHRAGGRNELIKHTNSDEGTCPTPTRTECFNSSKNRT